MPHLARGAGGARPLLHYTLWLRPWLLTEAQHLTLAMLNTTLKITPLTGRVIVCVQLRLFYATLDLSHKIKKSSPFFGGMRVAHFSQETGSPFERPVLTRSNGYRLKILPIWWICRSAVKEFWIFNLTVPLKWCIEKEGKQFLPIFNVHLSNWSNYIFYARTEQDRKYLQMWKKGKDIYIYTFI